MEHQDILQTLHNSTNLGKKIQLIHQQLTQFVPYIDRVAFAIYDENTDLLRTFLLSEFEKRSLNLYEAKLSEVPSLQAIKEARRPRIIEDISQVYDDRKEHSKRIKEGNYQASYTLPMLSENKLIGFIFFNSRQQAPFKDTDLPLLDVFAHLIFSVVLDEINQATMLLSALRTISKIMHFKDPETGNHLERMAHFARIIATDLAQQGRYVIDDEFIQFLFAFAPLHDIGKIGIPDQILLKPQKLDENEFQIMKQHTVKGRQIIDLIIDNLKIKPTAYLEMMRNIPELHHEKLDGQGYPHGYVNGQIPLEAQIIAVADIFDALTSNRPYKKQWSNQAALNYLKEHHQQLNPQIVQALERNLAEIEEIQNRFKDEELFEEEQ